MVLKKFTGSTKDEAKRASFLREVRMLKRARHERVVAVRSIFFDGDAYLEMPFYEGGHVDGSLLAGLPNGFNDASLEASLTEKPRRSCSSPGLPGGSLGASDSTSRPASKPETAVDVD